MILNDHKPGSILESSKIQNGKLMLNDHNDAIMDAVNTLKLAFGITFDFDIPYYFITFLVIFP